MASKGLWNPPFGTPPLEVVGFWVLPVRPVRFQRGSSKGLWKLEFQMAQVCFLNGAELFFLMVLMSFW